MRRGQTRAGGSHAGNRRIDVKRSHQHFAGQDVRDDLYELNRLSLGRQLKRLFGALIPLLNQIV
jgi:hypothetical protein